MSRKEQILLLRQQGYRWQAIASRFGVEIRQVMRLAKATGSPNQKRERQVSPGFERVAPLNNDIREVLKHDREPTPEVQARVASEIRRACTALRRKHLADKRGEE